MIVFCCYEDHKYNVFINFLQMQFGFRNAVDFWWMEVLQKKNGRVWEQTQNFESNKNAYPWPRNNIYDAPFGKVIFWEASNHNKHDIEKQLFSNSST